MFTIDDKQYRNLEEQVAKNANDILDIYQNNVTISEFGLKVINVSESGVAPVDPPTLEPGDDTTFGYAWMVKNGDHYDMYIWTRLEMNTTAGWLNVGEFPKQGPTGPTGLQGDKGDKGNAGINGTRGSIWTYSNSLPNNANNGDFCMKFNYDVFTFINNQWAFVGNIKGEKGDTGANGRDGATPTIREGYWYINGVSTGVKAQGVDGASLNIQDGIFTTGTLPSFSSTAVNDAYVVNNGTDYSLYFHGFGGTNWTIITNWSGVPGPTGPKGDRGSEGPVGPKGDRGPAGSVELITLATRQGNISREIADKITADPNKYVIKIASDNLFFDLNYISGDEYYYSTEVLDKPNVGDTYIYQLTINVGGLVYDITDNVLVRNSDLNNYAKVNGNNLDATNIISWQDKLKMSPRPSYDDAVDITNSELTTLIEYFNLFKDNPWKVYKCDIGNFSTAHFKDLVGVPPSAGNYIECLITCEASNKGPGLSKDNIFKLIAPSGYGDTPKFSVCYLSHTYGENTTAYLTPWVTYDKKDASNPDINFKDIVTTKEITLAYSTQNPGGQLSASQLATYKDAVDEHLTLKVTDEYSGEINLLQCRFYKQDGDSYKRAFSGRFYHDNAFHDLFLVIEANGSYIFTAS